MKYKLLKEIPWYKELEIIEFDADKYSAGVYKWDAIYNLIANMHWIWIENKEYFEKIEEKKSIYDLKEWDKYYSVSHTWINGLLYTGLHIDETILKYWNAFLTIEEALLEFNKRKAIATIKKWSYDNDNGYEFIVWEKNYYISFVDKLRLKVSYDMSYFNYWTQYYSSEEIAKRALLELRDEYNTLFWL